ncbi:MAG: sugar kinase [Flavobacteriales bacterium]|nr:sugar kinase [Flavobacteriales bacterium]
MSVLVVGTVAFDAIETPYGKTDKIVGGAATYIGLASSYFINKINLVSVVGEDFPKQTINLFKKKNICTKGLQIKEAEKTFFWSGKYHEDMNIRDTLETQLNVLENFDPILPEEYKNSEYLMLGNLMPSVQKKVLNQMKKRPKLIVLDTMNFWMDHFLEELAEAIKEVDVLTINDEEAKQLSKEKSLIKAAKKILKMGPKFLIIKKGEHGALLLEKDKIFYAPALPLEDVIDPTGAGDTFAGGFISYIAKKDKIDFETMKKAVINGSVMASFCVQKFGTEKLIKVDKEKIEKRRKQFMELVKF